jgi:signal transduction histidine kinase
MEVIKKIILNNTLKELMSALNAECGSLFLFDPEHNELVLEAFCNSLNPGLKGLRKRIGEGISGKVATTLNPVLVKDLDDDRRFTRNGFKHYRSKSFISLPLFDSKGLLGLINLTDKKSAEPFNENDLQVASAITKYASMAVDITDECITTKQEKADLNKQKTILEKYASVGKLAAGIVHEINNPLDGIIRYTNILLEQLESGSLAREYLMEIKTGLNRIANITKSLSEFSHVANSLPSREKRYVDINKLIDESLDFLAAKLNGNIKINRKYREGLPQTLDLGLQHVFLNLIKNAIDAMPEGGTLEISTGLNNGSIEITFKDTGTGVLEKIKERIFEPFFTTKGIDKGTGLGLAICREIINKYSGKILFDSAYGKGSTFTVLIPMNP